MQGDWTECVPLKYLILIPDIQEAKFFEFTVQILHPPRFISVFALGTNLGELRIKLRSSSLIHILIIIIKVFKNQGYQMIVNVFNFQVLSIFRGACPIHNAGYPYKLCLNKRMFEMSTISLEIEFVLIINI